MMKLRKKKSLLISLNPVHCRKKSPRTVHTKHAFKLRNANLPTSDGKTLRPSSENLNSTTVRKVLAKGEKKSKALTTKRLSNDFSGTRKKISENRSNSNASYRKNSHFLAKKCSQKQLLPENKTKSKEASKCKKKSSPLTLNHIHGRKTKACKKNTSVTTLNNTSVRKSISITHMDLKSRSRHRATKTNTCTFCEECLSETSVSINGLRLRPSKCIKSNLCVFCIGCTGKPFTQAPNQPKSQSTTKLTSKKFLIPKNKPPKTATNSDNGNYLLFKRKKSGNSLNKQKKRKLSFLSEDESFITEKSKILIDRPLDVADTSVSSKETTPATKASASRKRKRMYPDLMKKTGIHNISKKSVISPDCLKTPFLKKMIKKSPFIFKKEIESNKQKLSKQPSTSSCNKSSKPKRSSKTKISENVLIDTSFWKDTKQPDGSYCSENSSNCSQDELLEGASSKEILNPAQKASSRKRKKSVSHSLVKKTDPKKNSIHAPKTSKKAVDSAQTKMLKKNTKKSLSVLKKDTKRPNKRKLSKQSLTSSSSVSAKLKKSVNYFPKNVAVDVLSCRKNLDGKMSNRSSFKNKHFVKYLDDSDYEDDLYDPEKFEKFKDLLKYTSDTEVDYDNSAPLIPFAELQTSKETTEQNECPEPKPTLDVLAPSSWIKGDKIDVFFKSKKRKSLSNTFLRRGPKNNPEKSKALDPAQERQREIELEKSIHFIQNTMKRTRRHNEDEDEDNEDSDCSDCEMPL